MSSTPPHGPAPLLSTEDETPYSTPKFRPNSRRSSSFSSLSRSNSSDSFSESSSFFFTNASPPHSPITPLNLIRVPFSWEQTPGIPKSHKKTEPSGRRLLPLPPAGATTSSSGKKWRSQEEITAKKNVTRFKKDPFFAAMVECSKDDHDHGTNIWNKGNLSDRFGFISMYTSCKKTCAISESIVYVPRAIPHYLLHRDRRGPVKP